MSNVPNASPLVSPGNIQLLEIQRSGHARSRPQKRVRSQTNKPLTIPGQQCEASRQLPEQRVPNLHRPLLERLELRDPVVAVHFLQQPGQRIHVLRLNLGDQDHRLSLLSLRQHEQIMQLMNRWLRSYALRHCLDELPGPTGDDPDPLGFRQGEQRVPGVRAGPGRIARRSNTCRPIQPGERPIHEVSRRNQR
ncbi:MAG TPA: hypothetical protein VFV67_16390 [Actinophytocola sp.]|nr:hypothetical protein [Actinophytocola sp.]HEU5472234.1 hypothetical protein [Actinophytocola sp.]